MNKHKLNLIGSAFAFLFVAGPAFAKDKPISLEACPAPVQAVIRQYQSRGTLEEVALDEKKKSGGSAVYEAKFSLNDGQRIELHISPGGTVLKIEDKSRKN